jgi:tetratricopeptide (TPR) repeat protein
MKRLGLALLFASASGMPAAATAQEQAGATTQHDRLLDWAVRLEAADRPDEALTVLEDLLATHPTSEPALELLLRVTDGRGRVDPFLPWFERAGRPETASSKAKRLWVEVLVAAGRADSARSVARAWSKSRPGDAEAYLAWSVTEVALDGPAAGAETLRQGRREIGASAFAAEIGLLSVASADLDAAAEEWVLLIGAGIDASALEAAVMQDPAVTDAFARSLGNASRGAGPEVSAAAALLFLRLGRADLAGEAARAVQEALEASDRERFLAAYAEAARARGAVEQGAWAAGKLAALTTDPVNRDRWRSVAADMSLLAGDSAGARRAFEQLVRSVEPGSDAHRLAFRRLFALSAANPDDAEPMLMRYGALYPDPRGDLSEMRVTLARGFVRKDRLSDAARLLTEPSGVEVEADPDPDARLAAELGRVRLFAGDLAAALTSLQKAVAGGASDSRTRTAAIRLSAALLGADSMASVRFGRVLHDVVRDDTLSEIEQHLRDWELHEPPPEMMAIISDELESAGHSLQAARLRERLIDSHPEAPEAPVALLAIARYERTATRTDDGGSSPIARLERLILDYPESAVAPLARRLRAEWTGSSTLDPDGV